MMAGIPVTDAKLERRKTISVCVGCGKVRNQRGAWSPAEEVPVPPHAEDQWLISHGLCPACAARLYPEYFPTPSQ
ncbi:MAG: hypothetical protein Kow00109_22360 [Acidobacteriota bacterium]